LSDEMMRQAAEFYALSRKRDEKLMEKTLAMAKSSGKATVLITGGFHSQGISEMLRERKVAHMTISPKIHSFVEQDFYEKIMSGEDADPSYFLKTQNLGALFLLQPRQVYTDVFGENSPLSERQRAAILGSWVSAGSEALQKQGWNLDRVQETLSASIRLYPEIFGEVQIQQESGRLKLIFQTKVFEDFSAARSESRSEFTPNARKYLDQIAQRRGESTPAFNRLVAAMAKLEQLKKRELTNNGAQALYRVYAQSLDLPSRPVTVIEQLAQNVYNTFRIYQLPMAYRVAFTLQAFDETHFPNLHGRINGLMEKISAQKHLVTERLGPAEFWKVIAEFSRAEHQESIEVNILLRVALDHFIFHLEPEERRSLERQHVVDELLKELRVAGSGNFPEVVFLTDMHGAATVFDFVAFSLGAKNYQNIQSIPELEARLAAENIDVDKKNIVFVGGSDYVDRGPKPYWGFLVNKWLRSHGKLRFIIGNHDLWKDWYILGLHLRVNDALRLIADSQKYAESNIAEHLETMREFISAINLDESKTKELDELLHKSMRDFLEKAAKGEADEDVIQLYADMIIKMGTNPNHALEFWAREWGIHGNWFDTFFDQINEEAINHAVLQINQNLSGKDKKNIRRLLNSGNIPEVLVPHKEALLESLRQKGVLFSNLDLSSHPDIKANKKDILEARKHNEGIRKENELRALRGEPPLATRDVPSAFKISVLAAAQFLQSVVTQTSALNHALALSLPVPNLELISETSGRRNPLVMETALWDMQHFRLLYIDIYGNAYLHGIIPIDREKQNFNVTYKTKAGETLHGVAAVERIQYDVRHFFQNMETIPDTPQFRQKLHAELGNAFGVLNEWYSDVLGFLKPQQIRTFINTGGPSHFSDAYATSSSLSPRMFAGDKGVLHVGHVDPAKLYDAKIPYWVGGMEGGLIHGDFGASPGFLALGAVISWFHRTQEGLAGARRFGYRVTPDNIAIDLKAAKTALEKERKSETPNPEQITDLENTVTRLTNHLDRMQNGDETHQIEDITFNKLPDEEKEKIRSFADGKNLAKYYVERFLRENIETYQGLVKKAAEQGDSRISHYEEQLYYTQVQLEEFLTEFDISRSETRDIPSDERVLELAKGWVALHTGEKTSDHESLDDAFVKPLTDAEGAALAAKILNFDLEPAFAGALFKDLVHHLIIFPRLGEDWENRYMDLFLQKPELLMSGLLSQEMVRIEIPAERSLSKTLSQIQRAGYTRDEYQVLPRSEKAFWENHILLIRPKRHSGEPGPMVRELDKMGALIEKALGNIDNNSQVIEKTPDLPMVRSESRVAPQILAGFQSLSEFLGSERPYLYSRWVAVHITEGIILPMPADIWAKVEPFITADLLQPLGAPAFSKTKPMQFGLDLSVFNQMPNEEDLMYGIARVLNEEPNRYVRIGLLNSDDGQTQVLNTWFQNEFRSYPHLQGRFEVSALPGQGRGLESAIQKMIDEVRRRAQETGNAPSTIAEFYSRVSLSSTDLSVLNDIIAPLGARVQNDLPPTPGLQSHLVLRKLELAQGLMAAEKINKLREISSRIISASQFLAGEDLSRIEAVFENTIAALRAIYKAA
jgi:hypothetical protein